MASTAAASSAQACRIPRAPQLADVDAALAAGTASASTLTAARVLRARMAQEIAAGKRDTATATETEVMALLGWRLDYGMTRSCSGTWVRAG